MFDVAFERPLSVQVDGKSKMKPIENYGVKLLSIGFFTKPNQAVIWRGPMASKALNQMVFDADWGELEFLLIDLPPGTGDIHQHFTSPSSHRCCCGEYTPGYCTC